MGSIYLRNKTYWIQYRSVNGVERESSQSMVHADAKKLLRLKEGEIASGKQPSSHFEKVSFDELAEGIITDYKMNHLKSLRRLHISIKHLEGFFQGYPVAKISTGQVTQYKAKRLDERAKNSTINRELSALKRMFTLAEQDNKIDKMPHIAMLKEDNVRQGFFEQDDFLALRDALPEHLRGVATLGYYTGWRVSEITGLKWPQVDMEQGTIKIEPGESKSGKGRTVKLNDDLRAIFASQWTNKVNGIPPYVFPNKEGTGGISHFTRVWNNACKKAGIGHKLFHDLRRTAVRNMVRIGVPETVCMKITGHSTRSIFDRYNITNQDDIDMVAELQNESQDLGTNSKKQDTKTS